MKGSDREHRGMSKKTELSSKELQACATAASKRAVERARARKISYTVQEGRNIVQRNADGTKIIIETLPKAFIKPTTKRYRIA
jgi:hypothetical protein